jgi:hypothetical protein
MSICARPGCRRNERDEREAYYSVSRVLRRLGLNKLSALERACGENSTADGIFESFSHRYAGGGSSFGFPRARQAPGITTALEWHHGEDLAASSSLQRSAEDRSAAEEIDLLASAGGQG